MSETVDLTGFPQALANQLGISLFAGQIMASTIFLAMILLPTLFVSKKFGVASIATYVMAIMGLSVCVAIGWIGYWVLVLVVMMVALMFSGTVRGWLSD